MGDNLPPPRKSLCGSRSIIPGDEMEMQESQACHHFSIRDYASEIRKMDRNKCWPFSPMKEHPDSLPPMVVPNFRWWGCKSCLCMNDQIDKDRESLIPNASKRDDWMPRGQLSPIEENPESLYESENNADQESNVMDSILPDASERCLYKIDEIDKESNSLYPNALKRDDRISEGQLPAIEVNLDSSHERETDEEQECNIQDSTTTTVDLGGEFFETDLLDKFGNDGYIAVKTDGVLGSSSSVKRINVYYSRRPRKLRTLADIMKNEAPCPSGERNLPKQEEIPQKRGDTGGIGDNPLGDEQVIPLFGGEIKFPSRKRRYCPGGERKGSFSFKVLLGRNEKPRAQRLGGVGKRAKRLEDPKGIKANISKDIVTTTAAMVVPEFEASIPHSQAISAPTEKISVEVETSESKENGGRYSSRTLDMDEMNAVNEVKSILDDVPIEILEFLQSNFRMKHQRDLGHSTIAYLDRSSGIDNGKADSPVSYLRQHSIPGDGKSSTSGRAKRRSEKPKMAIEGPFFSAQNKPIQAHLDPDPFPAPYPCSCFSKVSSRARLVSEKGNFESVSKETLSAMQLLRLMDPTLPLNLKQNVGSFDPFIAQNVGSFDSLGITPLKSVTIPGNFPSLDGRERLSSSSRKRRRIQNPDSAARQVKKSTSNSIQFEFKNKGGVEDPLRGGQPELGFCALNMNPAEFCTVNTRSKLYMVGHKDLGPTLKKEPAVCSDITERGRCCQRVGLFCV